MKSEKEPNELKQQYKELSEKFRELTEEELAQVTGGAVFSDVVHLETFARPFSNGPLSYRQ